MVAIAWLDILPDPGQGAPGECRLGIHKADDTSLVVGIPKSGGNWSEREYFFKENKFIPQYPFERNLLYDAGPDSNNPGWRMTVIRRPGLSDKLDQHVFRNREAALGFQKYVTGYTVVAHCENVSWDATVRAKGFLLLDKKFRAEGEIQLWQPIEQYEPQRLSRVGTSCSTADPTSPPLHPLLRVQTGESSISTRASAISQGNGTVAHFNHDRPPLLVAFLRDGTKYNMIKIHIERDGLPFRRDLFYQPGLVEFQNDKGFRLERLEGEENSTDNRDVCAFARNSKTAAKSMIKETLTCLKITAQDQHQLNIFRNELDRVRQGYQRRELEQTQFREAINRRSLAVASESSSSSRRASSISFLPKVNNSAVFTESIQELFGDPVPVETRHELSPEYLTRVANYPSNSPPIGPTETGLARTSPPNATSPRTPKGRPPSIQTAKSGFSIVRRSTITATRLEESRGRRPAAPSFISTPPSESSFSRTASTESPDEAFVDLDADIRTFMSSTPGLGSADETIRTLHSLPGGPRALLYQFGSIPSSSDGEPGGRRRRFRCPFDIVYPQNGVNTGCQGPGFYPLDRLWRHLERHHSSFDCHNCLRDFHDYDGIEAHMLQGCRDRSTSLPSRIPFALLLRVERTLVPQNAATITGLGILAEENDDVVERRDIERWNRTWDVLFPSLGKDAAGRPSPFLEAPSISHDENLARLEMIFAAMVENDTAVAGSSPSGRVEDGNNGLITKTKAKRYLRAAIQALVGEELDPWERVLGSAELGVGFGRSGTISPTAVQVGWPNGRSGGLRNGDGDARLGSVGRDFLRLMGAGRTEEG